MHGNKDLAGIMRAISGVEERKCMKCGKCSASCPSYEAMDLRPHQFVSYLREGDVESMMASKSIWKCLSCFACVERCPRDVKPAQLIEAARLMVIRSQGENYISPDEILALLDPELPQQLLVSAFRKYAK
jgi:heterodisulfide reductase subunit C